MDVITSTAQSAAARVLVVADWALDPSGVVAACRRRAATDPHVTFALVVPAWLHGVDWAGDPDASRQGAARQLETLERLASHAGRKVAVAEVGDPDPIGAIEDVRAGFLPSEIMLFSRPRRLRHPFDVVSRIRRASRLPVHAVAVRATPRHGAHHGWSVLRSGGHCAHDLRHAA
jgi:hypothetical protein